MKVVLKPRKRLKVNHKLHNYLILLRRLRNTVMSVKIFLIIDADVAEKRFVETQRNTARYSAALIVVDDKLALRRLVSVVVSLIPLAVAVVGHEVVAHQRRHLREQQLRSGMSYDTKPSKAWTG